MNFALLLFIFFSLSHSSFLLSLYMHWECMNESLFCLTPLNLNFNNKKKILKKNSSHIFFYIYMHKFYLFFFKYNNNNNKIRNSINMRLYAGIYYLL